MKYRITENRPLQKRPRQHRLRQSATGTRKPSPAGKNRQQAAGKHRHDRTSFMNTEHPPDGIPETNIFMRYMRNGEIKSPTFRHGNPHAAGTGRTTGTCGLALLHNPVDFQRDINEM